MLDVTRNSWSVGPGIYFKKHYWVHSTGMLQLQEGSKKNSSNVMISAGAAGCQYNCHPGNVSERQLTTHVECLCNSDDETKKKTWLGSIESIRDSDWVMVVR